MKPPALTLLGALVVLRCLPGLADAQMMRSPLALALPDEAKMELVWIPPGGFMMGSADGPEDERPVRRVAVTRGFWIGKYEVAQEQFCAVTHRRPSVVEADTNPVEKVSYEDAQEFLADLNRKVPAPPGFFFRLPTEAEWEYACRAGTRTRHPTGNDPAGLKGIAWFKDNSDFKPHPVGQRAPNAWGVCDMLGNVSEWCADWLAPYSAAETTDPAGPPKGTHRVIRGGSFADAPERVSSSFRGGVPPSWRYGYVGFRIVCAVMVRPVRLAPGVPAQPSQPQPAGK
jgi:formylglycine-generating enzyme required for sulfatase activity